MPFTLPIPKLHGEHCLWVNELNFYKGELSHFQRRLKKYASGILIHEMEATLKNFRQRIHQLNKSIIMLEMELNEQEKNLVNFIKEVSGMGLNSFKMDNHVISREKMEIVRRSVIALKRDFRLFETKCK
jgi:septal ring factor EnvC (AmiA/AmiB activator)